MSRQRGILLSPALLWAYAGGMDFSSLCMPEETADAEGPVETHEVGPVPCC